MDSYDTNYNHWLISNTIEKTNFSSPEPASQKLFMDTLLPVTVLMFRCIYKTDKLAITPYHLSRI